jgi:hypothetical protein
LQKREPLRKPQSDSDIKSSEKYLCKDSPLLIRFILVAQTQKLCEITIGPISPLMDHLEMQQSKTRAADDVTLSESGGNPINKILSLKRLN